ncbi:FMN-binding protein, partial [Methanocalculus natronophilus]|uniref:FMN-binding protein n=1 Tax=Methanocalculus natronophilus TaxID=1262400 RepID=UPI0031B63941
KMIIFVVLMGAFTSALLVTVEVTTSDRIEQNQLANLYSAVLNANNESYTQANLADVFNDTVEEIEEDGLTFYVHKESGAISYRIEGQGVWGPIIGVVTLEDDFETIKHITILEQEETPGLGGVIEQRDYLDNYVGKSLYPSLTISRNADMDDENEVDAIVGGTRTSSNFQTIMNEEYDRHNEVFENLDLSEVMS